MAAFFETIELKRPVKSTHIWCLIVNYPFYEVTFSFYRETVGWSSQE